jgi:hypothetical protein
MKLTPLVHEAVICWSIAESKLHSTIDAEFHEAYAAECRLFNEYFKKFTPAESEMYRKFVQWLSDSDMIKSDLTIDELFDTYCTQVKGVEVGNIVKRLENDGLIGWRYYRITSIRGSKANLGAIFGKYIYHKGIPVSELIECEKEWYQNWTRSETYQCM